MKVKYINFFALEVAFFSSKFVGTVFVLSKDLALSSASIILSSLIAESSIILAKYF